MVLSLCVYGESVEVVSGLHGLIALHVQGERPLPRPRPLPRVRTIRPAFSRSSPASSSWRPETWLPKIAYTSVSVRGSG